MASSFSLNLLLCVGVTVSLRILPIVLLSHLTFPVAVREWLNFVPAAIMAALIVSELLMHPAFTEAGWSLSLLATLASFIVGIVTRSLFMTVFAGVAAFALFDWMLP
ncbi:AzlD domain-containing protein [Magnetospirillum molischianum]|uniref:Branched-chain amino acid transport n=1 Tax=Magnetospirillum molischianum DSM 120 TaxID=1150626 RepID=H8FR82_MAGML|nr:AzlD domain-containing protein [Magnetospirillum molischianum]CCG40870.1 Branched-chain amino acid transport [Magnetospirillum molischianum DSM 120]